MVYFNVLNIECFKIYEKFKGLLLNMFLDNDIGYLRESLISFIKYKSILLKILKNIKEKSDIPKTKKKTQTNNKQQRLKLDIKDIFKI